MAPLGPVCAACGAPIADRPATAALSPDGRSTWWLHRDVADCTRALKYERKAA